MGETLENLIDPSLPQYADVDYYKTIFKGTKIPDEKIEQMLQDASLDIDSLTFNRIVKKGFENLTIFQQSRIKYACCLQAEFINEYGEIFNNPISSYSAGTTSVAFNQESQSGDDDVITSKKVNKILKQTGLMTRVLL